MRRLKNAGCVYTGRVGAQHPLIHRVKVSRRVIWMEFKCFGGPLCGKQIRLDKWTGCVMLPIVLGGQVGQYRSGKWVPHV